MNKNQRGMVDIWFVVVLAVLIAAAVFTLWQINKADETISETEASTSAESLLLEAENPNEDFKNCVSGGGVITQGEVRICTLEGVEYLEYQFDDPANNSASEEATAGIPNGWSQFDSPIGDFTMKLPDGWSVWGYEDTAGFWSLSLLEDRTQPAEIAIHPTGGRGGPFLLSATTYPTWDTWEYQIDSDWTNEQGLDATKYFYSVEEDSIEGKAGDTKIVYVFDLEKGYFLFHYLSRPSEPDLTEEIELALTTLEVNKVTSPGDSR
ncbi:MAG: hypothetical protein R3313_04495 [Candidatus Saccharimonadales bacterium]|nr:hypothetical protein [Candidatus Saccharimonadales bacterium]